MNHEIPVPVGEYPALPSHFWMPYDLPEFVHYAYSYNPPHTSYIWAGIT